MVFFYFMVTIGGLAMAFICFWFLFQVIDWHQERQQEWYRRREMAKSQARWNALTSGQQRAEILANQYIPADYLPWVVINKEGEPCLPNFYMGMMEWEPGVWDYALIPMRTGWGGGLFTDEEVEQALTFAMAKTEVTSA